MGPGAAAFFSKLQPFPQQHWPALAVSLVGGDVTLLAYYLRCSDTIILKRRPSSHGAQYEYLFSTHSARPFGMAIRWHASYSFWPRRETWLQMSDAIIKTPKEIIRKGAVGGDDSTTVMDDGFWYRRRTLNLSQRSGCPIRPVIRVNPLQRLFDIQTHWQKSFSSRKPQIIFIKEN